MRQREKARVFRRFMRGETCWDLFNNNTMFDEYEQIEDIIREGLDGAFDPLPMKQARAYARAAGVKVGRMVRV